MTRCARSWTRCLAAAVAAGAAGTTIAAPPFPPLVGPQNFSSQHLVAPAADRAEPASLGETTPFKPPAITPGPSRRTAGFGGAARGASITNVMTEPRHDPPVIAASAANRGPQAGKGWIAAVGAFRRPGTYELSGDSITAAEFVERCGGATEQATGLRLVRNGRPLGLLHRPADRLIAGDVLIAEAGGSPRNPVTVAAFEDRGAAPRAAAEIGIVGLTGRPVAVKLPGAYATVPGVLQCAGQTHLSPADVTVLAGGIEEVPGDRIDALTSGSVVVFAPQTVDRRAVEANPPQTREYRADSAPPSVLPESMSGPAIPVPGADSRLVSAGLSDMAPVQTADAAAGFSGAGLSTVPPVEMLAPPADEPKFRYPRTADASGSVPIGAPEAEAHIVPVPTDVFPTVRSASPTGPIGASPPSAAPAANSSAQAIAAVEPIDLSTMDGDGAKSELPLGDLLPTIVVGGLLGAFTFLCIRWLRSLPLVARLTDRLLGRTVATTALIEAEPSPLAEPEPVAPPAPATTRRRAMAPDDLLAALIADRLAFREEDVAIPTALRVHGRSSALRKRRVDPPAAAVPEPHLPGVAARTPEAILAEKVRRHKAAEAAERGSVRIDPPRAISPPAPAAARTVGTPFERALAILNEAGQRNRL